MRPLYVVGLSLVSHESGESDGGGDISRRDWARQSSRAAGEAQEAGGLLRCHRVGGIGMTHAKAAAQLVYHSRRNNPVVGGGQGVIDLWRGDTSESLSGRVAGIEALLLRN